MVCKENIDMRDLQEVFTQFGEFYLFIMCLFSYMLNHSWQLQNGSHDPCPEIQFLLCLGDGHNDLLLTKRIRQM